MGGFVLTPTGKNLRTKLEALEHILRDWVCAGADVLFYYWTDDAIVLLPNNYYAAHYAYRPCIMLLYDVDESQEHIVYTFTQEEIFTLQPSAVSLPPGRTTITGRFARQPALIDYILGGEERLTPVREYTDAERREMREMIDRVLDAAAVQTIVPVPTPANNIAPTQFDDDEDDFIPI